MKSAKRSSELRLFPSDVSRPVRTISPRDDEWPQRLSELGGLPTPESLFVTGRSLSEAAMSVAVVGARKATAAGLEAAQVLARGLAEAGCTVVSGLAIGVDAVAHRAALDAGGHTIAVVGCGLDVNYPGRNERLRRLIDRQGTVVSEYPYGTPPYAANFPERNRIIVGLCSAVIVVEGTHRSGALVTARLALEANRAVFAVPGSCRNVMAEGPNELIRTCQAGLVTKIEHVFEELAPNLIWRDRVDPIRPSAPSLERDELDVLFLLDDAPQTTDRLAYRGGLVPGKVALTISRLEIRGLAARQRSGYVISSSGARARAQAAEDSS